MSKAVRKCLSPDEVDDLEYAGHTVRVISIATLVNGKRWCMVTFKED